MIRLTCQLPDGTTCPMLINPRHIVRVTPEDDVEGVQAHILGPKNHNWFVVESFAEVQDRIDRFYHMLYGARP